MINETSSFPTEVDKISFFQDIDLDRENLMNTYNSLIAKGSYSEAESFLLQSDGLYGYFAQLFNAFENRIYSTQEHLESISVQRKSPFVYSDDPDTEPENVDIDSIWT